MVKVTTTGPPGVRGHAASGVSSGSTSCNEVPGGAAQLPGPPGRGRHRSSRRRGRDQVFERSPLMEEVPPVAVKCDEVALARLVESAADGPVQQCAEQQRAHASVSDDDHIAISGTSIGEYRSDRRRDAALFIGCRRPPADTLLGSTKNASTSCSKRCGATKPVADRSFSPRSSRSSTGISARAIRHAVSRALVSAEDHNDDARTRTAPIAGRGFQDPSGPADGSETTPYASSPRANTTSRVASRHGERPDRLLSPTCTDSHRRRGLCRAGRQRDPEPGRSRGGRAPVGSGLQPGVTRPVS